MSALLALLIPLIPQLVSLTTTLINESRDKGEMTAAEAKAKLEELGARLEQTAKAVQALEIRDV